MRAAIACGFLLVAGAASAQSGTPTTPISAGPPHVCDQAKPADINIPTGPTVLSFTVTAEGEVKDPKIAKSSGNTELDARASKCVLDWRYRPAAQNGQPVDTQSSATITWHIPELNH